MLLGRQQLDEVRNSSGVDDGLSLVAVTARDVGKSPSCLNKQSYTQVISFLIQEELPRIGELGYQRIQETPPISEEYL